MPSLSLLRVDMARKALPVPPDFVHRRDQLIACCGRFHRAIFCPVTRIGVGSNHLRTKHSAEHSQLIANETRVSRTRLNRTDGNTSCGLFSHEVLGMKSNSPHLTRQLTAPSCRDYERTDPRAGDVQGATHSPGCNCLLACFRRYLVVVPSFLHCRGKGLYWHHHVSTIRLNQTCSSLPSKSN